MSQLKPLFYLLFVWPLSFLLPFGDDQKSRNLELMEASYWLIGLENLFRESCK